MTFFISCDNIIIMKEIMNILYENGYESYVVGGFVRDYLLGFSSKDIDICTNAPIDEIIRIFGDRGVSYPKYYAYHIEEDGFTYDITTYRKELKYRKNKPISLEIADDLGTDLLRRDFTINTFAISKDGLFIDTLGARKDLNSRLIKVLGDTNKKFKEDKTRILRAIRFACTLDFDLDRQILDFISNKNAYLLNEVPKEYKKNELDKIFDSSGTDKFFFLVKRYGMGKYLNIKFNKIIKSYNRFGIWAQIETDLPFPKKERHIIDSIKSLIEKKDINFLDLSLYSSDIIYNAASILGLEKKVKAFEDIRNLHSIIDMDIDPDVFFKYVRLEDIKKAYKLVERNIMEGYIQNNKKSIEKYLKEIRL